MNSFGFNIQNDQNDPINPDHYRQSVYQTIEKLMIKYGPKKVRTFCLLNADKYIDRAGAKGDRATDLKKADWYLELAWDLDGAESIADGMDRLLGFLERVQGKNDQ